MDPGLFGLHPERLRQGLDELAQSRLHGRHRSRGRSGDQEQRADPTLRQPGQIRPGTAHETPTAASSLVE
ncbi:hypothetical protein Hesp01_53000 [Herbidospora sp. NBRC 101105]|nr:hypothetical protein Hesp01_53000 [Herbidospora sp. NBRC 101105]